MKPEEYQPVVNERSSVGTLMLLCVVGLCGLNLVKHWFPATSNTLPLGPTAGDLQLIESSLADEYGAWLKQEFNNAPAPETMENPPRSWSQAWQFRNGVTVATVSFDQANSYNGWHELSECYSAQGWTLESREIFDESGDWPFVVSRFSKSPSLHNVIVFSLFFNDGTPVEPPDFTINQAVNRDMSLVEKLGYRATRSGRTDRSRQCQVLVTQTQPISEDQEKQAVELHLATRASVLEQWLKQ